MVFTHIRSPTGHILGPCSFPVLCEWYPRCSQLNIKTLRWWLQALYRTIRNRDDCALFSKWSGALAAWSRDCLLNFSKEKCLALCIRTPYNYPYSIEGHYLTHVKDQKDLGITISEDLKPSKHIQAIMRKASQRIGMIKRCFTNRSPNCY